MTILLIRWKGNPPKENVFHISSYLRRLARDFSSLLDYSEFRQYLKRFVANFQTF